MNMLPLPFGLWIYRPKCGPDPDPATPRRLTDSLWRGNCYALVPQSRRDTKGSLPHGTWDFRRFNWQSLWIKAVSRRVFQTVKGMLINRRQCRMATAAGASNETTQHLDINFLAFYQLQHKLNIFRCKTVYRLFSYTFVCYIHAIFLFCVCVYK